jgi:hypothetical protein
MLKKDPGVILKNTTEEMMIAMENGTMRTTQEGKLLSRSYNWSIEMISKGERLVLRKEANDLIKEIELKLLAENRMEYMESNEDPPVETWNWVLVVPWWRIIFEYKRFKIDEEKSIKEANVVVEKEFNQRLKQKEEEIVNERKVSVDTVIRKEPINIVFKKERRSEIDVMPKKKVDDWEEIPEPEIVKENDEYKVVRKTPLTDVQIELRKDDPVIPIPKDVSCSEKKEKKED